MLLSLVLACLVLLCLPVFAQDAPEALRPPKGAQLALVVFEDLQCPQCGSSRAAAGAGLAEL